MGYKHVNHLFDCFFYEYKTHEQTIRNRHYLLTHIVEFIMFYPDMLLSETFVPKLVIINMDSNVTTCCL